MKVKTGEIIKELKEKGVKYNQYHARIKWVVNYLGIKPTKTNQGNFYTKAEAKQIVRYICDGYRKWGVNHKSSKRTKANHNEGEQYTISWRQAYQIAENKLLQLSDRIVELEKENRDLKDKLEKKRKFWFFK